MTTTKNPKQMDDLPVKQLKPPRFEHCKPLLIAGLRGHFTTATWDGIPTQWQRLASYGKIPNQAGAAHYGLCFLLPDGVDYLCGIEISSVAGLPADFTHVTIPAQKYAVFAHHEHVSKLHDTMDAIGQHWFPESGHKAAPPPAGAPCFFERYGEKFDPITGMGDIEVWMPISS